MTAEEYRNIRVNDRDNSNYSQHEKNRIQYFDGYDLQIAFDYGQEEMKNKAIKYFCIEHCNIGQFENCFITNRCGVCKDFIEFLKKIVMVVFDSEIVTARKEHRCDYCGGCKMFKELLNNEK